MKKILALILALCMVFALAACGGGDDEEILAEDEIIEAEDEMIEEEPAEDAENAEAEEAEPMELTIGVIDGQKYTNAYTGVTAEFPEGWSVENIATVDNYEMEVVDEAAGLIKTSVKEIQELNASFEGSNVNVVYAYNENPIPEDADEKTFIADGILSEDNKAAMQAGLEASGMVVESIEAATVEYCGVERTAVVIRASLNGVSTVSVQLYDITLGDYFVVTTFTSVDEAGVEAIMAYVSALN